MGARILTVYEEKKLNNTQVHNTFLDEQEEAIPNCTIGILH